VGESVSINVSLPETIRRETHTLRQMADQLEKRLKSHNQKIRQHLKRVVEQGCPYVLIDGRPAKIVGHIGAMRVQVEFLDGATNNVKLETVECITLETFSQIAYELQKQELQQTEQAKSRLQC
jgi:uncharacterized Zn-binding protein involved in type VI secretion